MVVDLLSISQIVGEICDDSARQRDVTRLDLDPGALGEGLNDGEQGVGCEGGCLVDFRPVDFGGGHCVAWMSKW